MLGEASAGRSTRIHYTVRCTRSVSFAGNCPGNSWVRDRWGSDLGTSDSRLAPGLEFGLWSGYDKSDGESDSLSCSNSETYG